jgi:hypothetical protein
MKKKLFITLGLTAIIATSIAIGAYAASDIKLFINGKLINADLQIVDGSSYVPLRVVSESLGADVKWDGDKREISISGKVDPKSILSDKPSTSYSRSNPATVGTKVNYKMEGLTDNYEGVISIDQVIRGDQAFTLIKEANQFNGAAPEGFEYLLAKISVSVTANQKTDAKVNFSTMSFTSVSAEGKDYDFASVVEPSPKLDTSLYAGASNTGWTAFIVKKEDKAPLLAFGRKYDGTAGVWFKTN